MSTTNMITDILETDCRTTDTKSTLTGYSGQDSLAPSFSLHIPVEEERLIGREKESKSLLDAYQRVRNFGNANAVLVQGSAGRGKTALVNATLREFVTNTGGIFATGKFDQTFQQDPYSAIVAAFDDVCDLIVQHPGAKDAKAALNKSLGEELQVFARLVSGVSRLTGVKTSSDPGHEFGMGQAFTRFKQQCRSFLSSVASRSHPIVIFVDDLQFADAQSIEVVLSLLESRIKHVLFVISYRDEQAFPHATFISRLVDSSSELSKESSVINILNLDLPMVNSMISNLLRADPDSTWSLSTIVMSKTMGNPFYVLQYTRFLVSNGLLTYSEELDKWIWDETKVQAETNVTRNILEEITARAKNINSDVWMLLKLAALLGSVFETEVLFRVAETEWPGDDVFSAQSREGYHCNVHFHSLLGKAEQEGFLEKAHKGMHKWSHDKIQQSFLSEIPLREKAQLHYKIGKMFVLDDAWPLTSNKFFVAEQLNMGTTCIEDKDEIRWLAAINLDVGNLAISKSAFASGLQYFEKGISLLPADAWTAHYRLALDLFSGAANAAHSSGNFDTTKHMVEVILKKGETLEDKYLAYAIRVDVLGSENSIEESIGVGRAVLQQLGVRVPRRPNTAHVIYEILRAKRSISKYSDDDIISLPKMNTEKTMAMKIMSLLIRHAYYHSQELLTVLSLRMMRLSLKFGLCEQSPKGFCLYGVICIAIGNIDEGYRFGKLSIWLLDELKAAEARAYIYTFVYSVIFHFRCPIHELIENFVDGYNTGMKTGDVAFALMNGNSACGAMLITGVRLDILIQEFAALHSLLIEYNEQQILSLMQPSYQMALNFHGESDDPVRLTGDIMDEEGTVRRLKDEKNDLSLFITWALCFQSAFYFDAWYLADQYAELVLTKSHAAKMIENCYSIITFHLFDALFYLRKHRLTGKRRYRNQYRKIKNAMETCVRHGVPSGEAVMKFVYAEEMVAKESQIAVQAAYDAAIDALSQLGYSNYLAIAYELAGNAMRDQFSDKNAACVFYNAAQTQYEDWMAFAKSDHVQSKCRECQ